MAVNKTEWVKKIQAHAQANYQKGWDFVVECYTDDEIMAEIAEFTTYKQALGEFRCIVKLHKEQESNCSWGGEY
jgi:hypothetical protein